MQQAKVGGNSVRERIEEMEAATLSPWAGLSRESKGRIRPEPPDALRTAFQRDRDRVLHSKAFRRLKHKTQVFIAPVGDHFVTRLTHTLEVAQIARSIARALRLNEDLVEAAALGHDVGHTPFGHTGEQVLNSLHPDGFRHNEQSLRTVDVIEKDGAGLNLTHETREAILRHSKPRGDFLHEADLEGLPLEAQVVRVSDAIAYLAHDINDAIRARLLTEEELPADAREALGARHSQRVDSMVRDLVDASWECAGYEANADGQRPHLSMSPQVRGVVNELREFMFRNVYLPRDDSAEGREAKRVVAFLYEELLRRPEEVPERMFESGDPVERIVLDYIAGMTDHFALRTAEAMRPGFVHDVFTHRR